MLCFILSFGFLFRFSSMYIVTVKPTRVCCIFSSCACCCCLFCLMLCLVFLTNTPAAEWKYIFECFNIKYYFFHSFCPFLCLLVLSEWGFFLSSSRCCVHMKTDKILNTKKVVRSGCVLCYFFGKSRCIFFFKSKLFIGLVLRVYRKFTFWESFSLLFSIVLYVS